MATKTEKVDFWSKFVQVLEGRAQKWCTERSVSASARSEVMEIDARTTDFEGETDDACPPARPSACH